MWRGLEQFSDLGGYHITVARSLVQEHTVSAFGELAIPGRHIEVADAGAPGCLQRFHCVFVGDDLKLVAEGNTAQPELELRLEDLLGASCL